MTTHTGSLALVVAAALLLGGCSTASEIQDVADNLSGALEEGEGATTEAPAGDESLEGLIAASEGGDYLMEYTLNEEQTTLWFLQVNSIQVDGQAIAFSILPDPSGLYNFTVTKAGSDMVQAPFNEITAVTGSTPGLVITPSADGTDYTWTTPPTTWQMKADRDKRVTYYRMESPEGVFEMDFYYDQDITDRIPQSFIDGAAEALTTSGQEVVFGFTNDNFATWEITEF